MSDREHRFTSALVASLRDVIDERPEAPDAPAWSEHRGWRSFLESLSDDEVAAAERDGLAWALPSRAPSTLTALARDVRHASSLAVTAATDVGGVDHLGATPRKRAQVAAFAALAHTVAGRSTRVVDVGSGHGHLTRHLARALTLDAVGWERDPARVAVATRRTHDDTVRFVAVDAATLTDTLGPRDLVVALHACGALGDLAACAAAEVGAPVALVGCCLQKREGDRAPLVAPPGIDARALTLARRVLGLGNVCDGDEGVEADLATRVRARVQRDALRTLLREAGVALVQGEEMRGLNRRRATGDFEALVTAAFGARGLAAPPATHATAALATQWIAHARLRRWTLPRTMLGRVVEVWVAHDRAALLRQRGYDARVVAAFEATWSARNVAVLGAPRRAHA